MTAPATTASQGPTMTSVAMRHLRRNTWVVGLLVFLVLLLLFTKFILPSFGPTAFTNLALAALPFALVTAGQAIAVLTGGIDLSMASMMAVAGVVAARLMDGSSDGFVIVAVLVVIGVGLLMGAINGALIVYTRVPDIIVTLAMLFVWGGIALVILDRPGGSMAQWLRDVISGTLVIDWAPKALIFLIVVVAAIWVPVRRSTLGLSIYAVGSDRLAALRSGVNVGRTKILAYALTGLFAALAGLVVVMATGQGDPLPGQYLLASVAAVVLGGVSLAGGRGTLIGPIVAVFILRLLRADLTFMSVDSNYATVIEGAMLVGVVMLGAVVARRGERS
jgi:ribose transport system permease protein